MTARGKYGPVLSYDELIAPLGDQILVRRDDDRVLPSGIELLESTPRNSRATVLGVGPGTLRKNGLRVPPEVSIGDRVILHSSGGQTIYIDQPDGSTVEMFLITEAAIVAVENSEGVVS